MYCPCRLSYASKFKTYNVDIYNSTIIRKKKKKHELVSKG